MNLTQLGVERLRPGPKEVIWWDTNMPGFGLRVSPKGRKTFLVQYRIRGAKGGKWLERQEALGTLADLKTLSKARDLARDRRVRAREGVDPVMVRNVKSLPTATPISLPITTPVRCLDLAYPCSA
jgi:hypothetical protein